MRTRRLTTARTRLLAVPGGVVYLLVDDVDGLHEELVRKNIAIDTGPLDQEWGGREMYVKDPDGNSIRFCCPSVG